MRTLLLTLATAFVFAPAISAAPADTHGRAASIEANRLAGADITKSVVSKRNDKAADPRRIYFTNSAPTANDDIFIEFTTVWGWSGCEDVLANDTDPDLPNDTLTITGVTGSSYVSVSGSLLCFSGPPGTYFLNYTIEDSYGATSDADVYWHVSYCSPYECS